MLRELKEVLVRDKSGMTNEQLVSQWDWFLLFKRYLLEISFMLVLMSVIMTEMHSFMLKIFLYAGVAIVVVLFIMLRISANRIIDQIVENDTMIIEDYISRGEFSNLTLINEELCQRVFQEALRQDVIRIMASSEDVNVLLKEGKHQIRLRLGPRQIFDFFDVEEVTTDEEDIRRIVSYISNKDFSKLLLVREDYKQRIFQECLKKGIIEISSAIGKGVSILFKGEKEIRVLPHSGIVILQSFMVKSEEYQKN